MIRYLKNKDIDREVWDRCIQSSRFETIYAYSWYLDLVSAGWEGLVLDDYEAVMPLTRTRKLGMELLLQPKLAQQLGLFSTAGISESESGQFLQAIPSRFRYVDICLNKANPVPRNSSYKVLERLNFELDLSLPEDRYHQNTRRNLQRGIANEFRLEEISAERYLGLKYARPEKIPVNRDYLKRLFGTLSSIGRAEILGLYLGDGLHAAAVMGWSETRAIYMNGCTTHEGRESRAMFILMDHLIRRGRERAGIFDFEGSNIPGVARFFEGFGAKKTIYHRMIMRRFPFLWRMT